MPHLPCKVHARSCRRPDSLEIGLVIGSGLTDQDKVDREVSDGSDKFELALPPFDARSTDNAAPELAQVLVHTHAERVEDINVHRIWHNNVRLVERASKVDANAIHLALRVGKEDIRQADDSVT